jgi:hypothetical protein
MGEGETRVRTYCVHRVEGDEQDKDGKNKFSQHEFKAILRFGAEKLFEESGPTPDDGW